MSEESKLLSQDESALLAGVCTDTIKRYRDLGLLRVYTNNGNEQFSEDDIRLLFNARIKAKSTEPEKAPIQTTPKSTETDSHLNEEKLPRLQDIVREASIKSSETSKMSNKPEPLSRSVEIKSEIHSTSSETEQGNTIFEAKPAEINSTGIKPQGSKPVMPDGIASDTSLSLEKITYSDSHNNEDTQYFSRQRRQQSDFNSIELLEITRSLKDQLEIVKEERNWLRKRIEKLESQTEREQMILMSETETIRSLVHQQEAHFKKSKQSPWSFLLSWTNPKEP